MKKIIFLLLLIPLLLQAQNAKEIAKKCMSSTVSIVMEDQYKQPFALGSGFIVGNGKIITNLHVIEGAKFGYIIISGETTKHKIEGIFQLDKKNDLALLSVPTLFGNSIEINFSVPEIGEKIYAIGNPKGLSGTISEGIVSAIRNLDSSELIQITAPISPGSSGGPVINNNGELVGVSVGTLESGQNINFAIPTKFVIKLLESPNLKISNLNIINSPVKPKQSNNQNIKNGAEIVNIEWETQDNGIKVLKGFSIKNNTEYQINKIKLIAILKDVNGLPIDSKEFEPYLGNSINPFLSKYYNIEEHRYGIRDTRIVKKRKGEKLELRVLDFTIIQ